MDRGRGVNAGEQRTIKISRNVWPERGYVAAQIGNGLDTQAEKLAVLIERELGLGVMMASVRVRPSATKGHDRGQDTLHRNPPMTSAITNIAPIYACARSDPQRDVLRSHGRHHGPPW